MIHTTKKYLTEHKIVSSCKLMSTENLSLIRQVHLRLLCEKFGNDIILEKFQLLFLNRLELHLMSNVIFSHEHWARGTKNWSYFK